MWLRAGKFIARLFLEPRVCAETYLSLRKSLAPAELRLGARCRIHAIHGICAGFSFLIKDVYPLRIVKYNPLPFVELIKHFPSFSSPLL